MKQREWLVLWLTLLLAAALRLDLLIASNFVIDADEAIVGLMAKHVSEGQPWPTFYYGQHYMGSLEPLLVSVLFALFGPSVYALKAVPLLCSLLLVPPVYLLARHIAGPRAAAFASLFIAIPPTPLVIWSSKARGGFIEVLVIGALALLVVTRWLMSQQRSKSMLFIAGVVLGLGWWINNQTIYFILPIGLVCLLASIREGRGVGDTTLRALVGGAGFLLGGLPFWWYNVQHSFVSFRMFRPAEGGALLEQVLAFFTTALPILLGAKAFWHTTELFPGATLLVVALYLVILLALPFARTTRVPRAPLSPLGLQIATLLTCAAVFSLSSFGWLVEAPRYLLPAYVPLAVLVGVGGATLRSAIPFVVLLACNLYSSYPLGTRAIPGEPFVYSNERVAKDHGPLIAWLDEQQIRWVRTNYWIGYRLAFETDERIRFRVFQTPHEERIQRYITASDAPPLEQMPLLLTAKQAAIVERALTALGYRYERAEPAGYVVLYGIQLPESPGEPVSTSQLRVTASDNDAAAAMAIDGALDTRWGSASPQRPAMQFTITLEQPTEIIGLQYVLANWPQDFPRGLRVEVFPVDGRAPVTVLDPSAFDAIRYYSASQLESFTVRFDPLTAQRVVLTITGQHSVFDWSIAELILLAPTRAP